MQSENHTKRRSLYVRSALLVLGWLIAAVVLYALSTVLPVEILAIIVIGAYAIVRLDRVSRKNKSLASHLCAITCLLTGVGALAMHITRWRENILERLIFVGLCLGAGLIILDRQADDWQS